MDFPIHIDTISIGLPILYLEGSQIVVSKLLCIFYYIFLSLKLVLILANSEGPYEMQQ